MAKCDTHALRIPAVLTGALEKYRLLHIERISDVKFHNTELNRSCINAGFSWK